MGCNNLVQPILSKEEIMFKSKDIFKEVKRLALEMTITSQEFFLSDHLQEYFENVAEFLTKRYKRKVQINRDYNSKSQHIAYTTGDMIYINGDNDLANFYSDLKQKFYCWLGIFFHEISHILFLDFPKLNKAVSNMNAGLWWPDYPEIDDVPLLDEINEYLATKKATGKILAKTLGELANIVADVHDERAITQKYGALVEKSLTMSIYAMHESTQNLEDNIAAGYRPLSLIYGLILSYIRFDEIFMAEEDYENEYVKVLKECMPYIDEAREAETMEERFNNINIIITILWPYIKAEVDKIEESDGKDGSEGGGNPSKGGSAAGESSEALDELMDELEKALGGMATEAATGTTAPVKKDSSLDGECPSDSFETLEKGMKEEKAEKSLESERITELDKEIKAVGKDALHKGIKVNLRRKVAVTKEMKATYEKIAKEVRPYAKTLERQIYQALKEKREGGKSYGAIFGSKFESRSIARTDGRYFSKKKLPTESPSLAVGVLVDESGSMGGARETAARLATILIEMFTSALDIPTLICGHSTEGHNDFSLYSYVEPGKIDKNDRYRLADIRARSQNRDGLALKIMCERMSKMTEDIKLLIVISDGQPCDHDYGGASAEKEMRDVCREYRRKGVTIFAAAIGSDKDNIHRIYKDGFLDITDLSKLPKTMINLIKKEIKY